MSGLEAPVATWVPEVEYCLESLHARDSFFLEMEEERLKSKLLEKAGIDFFLFHLRCSSEVEVVLVCGILWILAYSDKKLCW